VETTLHRQLKQHFAGPGAELEVKLGRYRIDIVDNGRLVEVQVSGLSAIRDKIRDLCKSHQVEVIKPLIARKQLVQLNRKGGKEISRRWSPKQATRLDIFHELIHFTNVFPHPNLTLRIPLLQIEEFRTKPTHRRWRRKNHKVLDQKLISVEDVFLLKSRANLRSFIPNGIDMPFDTKQLAEAIDCPRWVAQRIAYCLRKTGCIKVVGKRGNAILYRTVGHRRKLQTAA